MCTYLPATKTRVHRSLLDVACKIAELVSQRRSDSAAAVVAALAHLPFRPPDLTPDIVSGPCAHWCMPGISLTAPPCTRLLDGSQPDSVVVFLANDGVAVNGAVFLPCPPSYPPPAPNLHTASPSAPFNGGTIQLAPFSPFDMMQPQSIYNSKGTGASLSFTATHLPPTLSSPVSHFLQLAPSPHALLPSECRQPWSKPFSPPFSQTVMRL